MQAVTQRRFDVLIMTHLNALYQTALQLTRHREDAEALVRDVCTTAFESFNAAMEDQDCRVELFKMLFHRTRLQDFRTFVSENRDEPARDIESAIRTMPPMLREVILLVDCQEFSYDAAAEILAVPRETVAERVTAARSYLQANT